MRPYVKCYQKQEEDGNAQIEMFNQEDQISLIENISY